MVEARRERYVVPASRGRTASPRSARRAGRHDRASRAPPRPARLLSPPEPGRSDPPHPALDADKTGLEPPRSPHHARGSQRPREAAPRAVRQFATVASLPSPTEPIGWVNPGASCLVMSLGGELHDELSWYH